MAAAPRLENLIGGERRPAEGGETFDSIGPATGEKLGEFPRSGAADVDRAVAAAKAAFADWRLVPAPERGAILFRFAELLRGQKEELTELMTREMGKVRAEAGGDVQEAIDMSLYMGGEGRRLWGQTTPSELRDKFMMSVRMPVGVVGAITPWNFPIAIPAWKLCPALVCGNTVVLKPAEDTPFLAERFVELLTEAGVPPGVVNIVHGFGEEAGEALVRHPDVPIITFTGSRETGVAVTKAAADHLKHVHLELGGKNAIVVMDDADVELAIEGIVWSAFGTSGQRCTAASRVIVHEAVYGELQSKLVAAAERLRLGPGWEDSTDVGPLINRGRARPRARVHGRRRGRGRDASHGRRAGGRRGVLLPADRVRGRRPADADRAGGDLRADDRADPGRELRRGDRRRERGRVRALVVDLHERRRPRVPRDARPRGRDHVRQRGHDRRRGAPAVRRRESDRQRPPRGRPGRTRRLHRVEVDLRRLLGEAATGPDRQRGMNRKLVVFVPPEALDAVRDAVFAAGAGRIGEYERCSWYAAGTGTFLGGEGASPVVGECGVEERVPELRLETVFPEERHAAVVAALRMAHPYEEPAFDVYPLL